MKKILLLVLNLMLVMSLSLSGCTTAAEIAKAGKTFIFTDSVGRKVELPTKLTRVSPSGAIAAMVLYAVAPEKLVSTCRPPVETYKKYYTKEYLSLPSTGQIYGISDINLEELIRLNPQVIIDLGDIKKDMAADLDAFQEQTGIPIIFIEATTNTYPKAFRTLGKLLGEKEQGEAMAKFTEETMAMAEKTRTQITDKNRLRVMFGTGESGLNCNAKGSIHCSVLETVGVENAIVVPDISSKGGGNTVTMEEVLNADPDVILLDVGGPYSKLGKDEYWSGLRAVKEGDYYEIPCGPFNFLANPPSINQIIGIEWLGSLLYPDLYNIDIKARIQNFYKTFWHYDLNDEEAAKLLSNSTLKEQ